MSTTAPRFADQLSGTPGPSVPAVCRFQNVVRVDSHGTWPLGLALSLVEGTSGGSSAVSRVCVGWVITAPSCGYPSGCSSIHRRRTWAVSRCWRLAQLLRAFMSGFGWMCPHPLGPRGGDWQLHGRLGHVPGTRVPSIWRVLAGGQVQCWLLLCGGEQGPGVGPFQCSCKWHFFP